MSLEKELKEMCEHREKLAQTIQNDVVALSKKLTSLQESDLKIYQKLQSPDALFNDSPLSPFVTAHLLKQFMIKKGMSFIGYALDGVVNIKDFALAAKETTGWIMRFAKEIPKPKSGLDAILRKEEHGSSSSSAS